MNSTKRRDDMVLLLINSDAPLKGIELAKRYGVTRQVIVKDIAILRANGKKIIATPEGYIVAKKDTRIRKIIAANHDESRLKEELTIIIKLGGIVEDVIVEHPLYGEIRGVLMIKNFNDLDKFLLKYKQHKAKLLLMLTNGVHNHTISAKRKEDMDEIIKHLKEKGFLIK